MSDSVYMENPYCRGAGGVWLKGCLHLHTTRSDGRAAPEDMLKAYAAQGYDFLAVADHDVASDYTGLDPLGMTLLHGCEVTAGGPHILQVGGAGRAEPVTDRQKVIDDIRAAGGMAILNHPNWGTDFNHFPFDAMAALRGYAGIEIVNATVLTHAGNHLATDKWDRLLTRGVRAWGLANDDAHRPDEAGTAWNRVLACDRSPEAIMEALRGGCFHASTGVRIESIEVDGMRLVVVAPDAQAMAVVAGHGRRVCRVEGSRLEFDAAGEAETYFRVECFGRGGSMAWTQPFHVRGGEVERRQRLAEEKPVVKALRAERVPRSRGGMDDPLWEQAPAADRFLRMKDAQPSAVRTEMRCIASPEALHIAFLCEEPAMDQLRTQVTGDGTELWHDDSVEVFLVSPGSGGAVLQVMASAAGRVYGVRRGQSGPVSGIRAWGVRDRGRWTLEMAIPRDVLGCMPGPGARWGFHACRNRKPVAETLVWAWVGESNHLVEHYGIIEF